MIGGEGRCIKVRCLCCRLIGGLDSCLGFVCGSHYCFLYVVMYEIIDISTLDLNFDEICY